MTRAERHKLLLRRRQWQRFRAKLLALGIDYDNPPGIPDWVHARMKRDMQSHDAKSRDVRIQEYRFDA